MADGPYRHIEIEEVRCPRGIAFFGNDEGLRVEVKRALPLFIGGAAVFATAGTAILAHRWGDLFGPVVVAANASYWFWPRLRRTWANTTIDIRNGAARFEQRNVARHDAKVIPLGEVGPPKIGEIVIERIRLPDVRLRCLQFDQYVDGVRGGQSVPIQILAGYRSDNLEWIRKNIVAWMTRFGQIAA